MFFKKKKKDKKFHLLPRLIVGIFMAIAVAQSVGTIGAFSSPEMAFAADNKITFKPQVAIPGMKDITFGDSTRPIAEYIKAIYLYAVGAVGILATVMLMIGGLRWILAAGNPSSISEAKDMIIASISGMVLVLTSYLVLNQVNPALTDLSKNITKIESIAKKENAATSNKLSCAWTPETNTPGFAITGGCINSGTVESPEGDCTKTKPTETGNTTQKCCCSYSKSIEDNCSWTTSQFNDSTNISDYCQSNQTAIAGDEAIKKCGTSGYTQICCCEPRPIGCPSDPKINCKACENCQPLTVPCKNSNSCQLNPTLASKLNRIYETQKGWRVTEAWPPTYPHKSSCHTNGLCVDINLDNGSTDKDEVKALAEKLTAAGLTSFQYECTSGPSCCTGYAASTRCTYNDDASANHFHVNN